MSSDSPPKHQAASNAETQPGSERILSRTAEVDRWTESMEPDERRRIQNRNAQRKFRKRSKLIPEIADSLTADRTEGT